MIRQRRIAWACLVTSLGLFAYLALTEPVTTQASFSDSVSCQVGLSAAGSADDSHDCEGCDGCPRRPRPHEPRPTRPSCEQPIGTPASPTIQVPLASTTATPSIEVSPSIEPTMTPLDGADAPGPSAEATAASSGTGSEPQADPPSAAQDASSPTSALPPDVCVSVPATPSVDASPTPSAP
jgi:hypothetical protein